MRRTLSRAEKVHFLNEFRQARAAVLRDAEAVDSLIHVLERLGSFLLRKLGALGDYGGVLGSLAGRSPLARKLSDEFHTPFPKLFESVRDGRNSAMHEGAYARHLASHAVKLALTLEDALSNGPDKHREATVPNLTSEEALMNVEELMVSNPICAEIWQPLSFIRQTMLENSFSFLPVLASHDGESVWKLVSDLELARYLRRSGNPKERESRLVQTLDEAWKSGGIRLRDTNKLGPKYLISDLFKTCDGEKDWDGLPILVVINDPPNLVGILSPLDLL
jgi:hypothetical protein